MKIRTGFVSNSSSSSFLIYGICITRKETKELRERLKLGDEEDDDVYNAIDNAAEKLGLAYHNICDYRWYLGLDPRSMKDDETMAQFKVRAETLVKNALGEDLSEFDWHEEAWRNG